MVYPSVLYLILRRRPLFRLRSGRLRYRVGDSIAANRKVTYRERGLQPPFPTKGYGYPKPDPLAPQRFRYRPLDRARQQIRLCKYTVAEGSVTITMRHFDFDESCPKYVALSYTWGDPEPLKTVELNGYGFKVRGNLHDYLVNGTEPAYDWIWIDAIAIDQENILERNAQVDIMADIYSRAQEVLVWLGDSSDTVNAALRYLHRTPPDPGLRRKKGIHDYGRSRAPTSGEIEGFVDIFSRSYWSRLWVTQELVRAHNVVLCCSGGVADLWSWEKVMIDQQPMLAYRFKDFASAQVSEMVLKAADGIDFLALCRLYASRHVRTNNLNPLGPTLSRFCQGRCDDMRDKIYGLQGMVREDQRVQVDYSKTPNEVYVSVAMALAALSRWNEASDGACHELRSLREELGLGVDLLDCFEDVLGISLVGEEDDPGPQDASVTWPWDSTAGDGSKDRRWDRIMKSLPWGENALKIIKTLTMMSEHIDIISNHVESV